MGMQGIAPARCAGQAVFAIRNFPLFSLKCAPIAAKRLYKITKKAERALCRTGAEIWDLLAVYKTRILLYKITKKAEQAYRRTRLLTCSDQKLSFEPLIPMWFHTKGIAFLMDSTSFTAMLFYISPKVRVHPHRHSYPLTPMLFYIPPKALYNIPILSWTLTPMLFYIPPKGQIHGICVLQVSYWHKICRFLHLFGRYFAPSTSAVLCGARRSAAAVIIYSYI